MRHVPKITDQYNGDPLYAELHVLTRNRPLAREMLKTASFEEKRAEIDNLPSSAFAWESERRFPIHTREDTIASILYRSKLGSAVPKYVDDALASAAEIYKVDEHIFVSKTASGPQAEVPYALPVFIATKTAADGTTVQHATDPEKSRLPLGNSAQIKIAEQVLCRDYERLPLEKRADAFSRLVAEAKKHAVELTPLTQKMAGMTISSTATLRQWLEARASASEGKVQAAFDKLAEELKRAPSHIQNRPELIKLATTIEQLDRKAGLDKYYDRKLPDPLQTVFNTNKLASLTCDMMGMQVPVSQLMQLPPDIWQQVDVPELAEIAQSGDEAQFKQVFDTLPADIKAVLKHQLS